MVECYWQGKTEVLEKTPYQCHFVHNSSHMDWHEIETWLLPKLKLTSIKYEDPVRTSQ